MRKRGNLTWDTLIPWVIGVGVLALVFISYLIISGKMNNAADFLKDLFRFRR